MIASKGQTVRLIGGTETAKVAGIVTGAGYDELPPGERGVRLDKPLDDSVWTTESDIEPATV